MRKVVITGASGFVGRALVKECLRRGDEVIGLVRSTYFQSEAAQRIEKNLHFIAYNLENLLKIENDELKGADVLYHLAWEGSAGESRRDEKLQLKNVEYTTNAVHFAKRMGIKRFIGAGSIMEVETYFATRGQGNKLNSAYIYGMAKLMAHCLSKAKAAEIGIDHIWPMITNAYGVGEKSPRFINTTLRKIINGQELEFTSGTQNYDFIYIDDVANALYLLGKEGKSFNQYVLGSGKAGMLRDFIEQIGTSVAPNKKLIFGNVPYTGVNLPLSEFDSNNLFVDVGFKIKTPFNDGIKKTYQWLLEEKTYDSKV